MLRPSSTTLLMGTTAKLKTLISGTIAHRQARIFQFSMPNRVKNSVDSATTATTPQQ